MDKFLSAVHAELLNRRMTREELAKKSGISVRTITNWYQRGSSPKLKDAYRIAGALGMSLDRILWPVGSGRQRIDHIESYLLQMDSEQREEVQRFCEFLLSKGAHAVAEEGKRYGPSESTGG